MKNLLSFILEIGKIVIIALAIVIPIRYFLFQPFIVRGQSMEPNFKEGDYLIVDEISYRFHQPKRGEVVVFRYPADISQKYIKRIIGLPGETIEIKDGKIKILDEKEERGLTLDESFYLSQSSKTPGNIKIGLKDNEYFVLGDNRFSSYDSRFWGVLPGQDIIGKVLIRVWPSPLFFLQINPDFEFQK